MFQLSTNYLFVTHVLSKSNKELLLTHGATLVLLVVSPQGPTERDRCHQADHQQPSRRDAVARQAPNSSGRLHAQQVSHIRLTLSWHCFNPPMVLPVGSIWYWVISTHPSCLCQVWRMVACLPGDAIGGTEQCILLRSCFALHGDFLGGWFEHGSITGKLGCGEADEWLVGHLPTSWEPAKAKNLF